MKLSTELISFDVLTTIIEMNHVGKLIEKKRISTLKKGSMWAILNYVSMLKWKRSRTAKYSFWMKWVNHMTTFFGVRNCPKDVAFVGSSPTFSQSAQSESFQKKPANTFFVKSKAPREALYEHQAVNRKKEGEMWD